MNHICVLNSILLSSGSNCSGSSSELLSNQLELVAVFKVEIKEKKISRGKT